MMNISTHGHSRLQEKLDKFFWFIIGFLPIIFWLCLNIGRSFIPVSAEEQPVDETPAIVAQADENVEYGYRMIVDLRNVSFSSSSGYEIPEGLSEGFCFFNTGYGGEIGSFSVNFGAYSSDLSVLSLRINGNYYIPFNSVFVVPLTGNEPEFGFLYDENGNLCFYSDSYSLMKSGDYSTMLTSQNPITVLFERYEIESVESTSDFIALDTVLMDYFGIDYELAPVSVVTNTLSTIFADGGIFPFFNADSGVIYYMTYFVYVQILHVLVDILVFIPRFAHKILDKAVNFGD